MKVGDNEPEILLFVFKCIVVCNLSAQDIAVIVLYFIYYLHAEIFWKLDMNIT